MNKITTFTTAFVSIRENKRVRFRKRIIKSNLSTEGTDFVCVCGNILFPTIKDVCFRIKQFYIMVYYNYYYC